MNKDIIYIDSREPKYRINNFIKYIESHCDYINDSKKPGLKPIYEKIKNGEKWYEITNLEYGDFIYNDVIIEYKTEDDFISSSRRQNYYSGSTRLNTQLDECNRFATQAKVCLVLEGDINKVQSEFLTRMSFKSALIIEPNQQGCFKLMLYVMKIQDTILDPPTNNFKSTAYPFGVGILLNLGFPLKQANAITKKYMFMNINDIIKVFSQDFDSFKKDSKVKYLKEDTYIKAQRRLCVD